MDPISVSTSVIALLGNVQKLMGIANVGDYTDPDIGDFPVLAALYRDINSLVLASSSPPPYSTDQALRRCRDSQDHLIGLLEELGYSKFKRSQRRRDRIKYVIKRSFKRHKLERAQKDFRNSVLLLRGIAMDAVTHQRLESIRLGLGELLETLEVDTGGSDVTGKTKSHHPLSTLPFGSDPSLFNATITTTSTEGVRYIPARGKFDTGSDINLISSEFIKRTHITNVDELESSQQVQGIQGILFTPKCKTKLTWYLNNSSNSRETEFYVVNDDDFDLLLGNPFINGNKIFSASPRVFLMRYKGSPEDNTAARMNQMQLEAMAGVRRRREKEKRARQQRKENASIGSDDNTLNDFPSASTLQTKFPSPIIESDRNTFPKGAI